MGLLEALDYTVKPANVLQRAMQRLASSRPGAWVFQRTVHPVDKLLFRMSRGRHTATSVLAGVPVILLTTTGARSGTARTMPLLGVPFHGQMAVVGSNYGQKATPGWVHNLEADPTATVSYRGRSVEVTARRASDDEADEVFGLGAAIYPGFPKYRERVSREIRVFVLEPAAP